ncbi:Fantastic Four domain [Dillenia turbinata]|uniref:Fantastic Four domain n=1 Tax=Dillenia turbinata TaxID=194707 RepID=A0AAN8W341_9MAGN
MKRKNDFPPPIPMLARTENLPSHMPWILKRYYTNDGRLIICEEKVKHHEYFRAHRSNGRLTLQLVPLDDGVSDDEFDYDDEDDYVTDGEDERDCLSEDDHQAAMVERDGELRPSKSAPVIIGTSSVETAGSGKCCEYNHMRSPDRGSKVGFL